MKSDTLFNESNRATYCPEDNKLRLYVGRVPRDEYEALRAEGWTSTPKQDCDFVAHWTPARRDTCLAYAGILEDEDAGPEERAADRAERFDGYLGKRMDEAGGHADRYDAGPAVHGFQSMGRAVRAADRHDRLAGRAVDAWEKAEYWQRRTAGVISHALYVSSPAVRMGRIKEIEADIRRMEKSRADYEEGRNRWLACQAMPEGEGKEKFAAQLAYIEHGDYIHPRTGRKSYLYDHTKSDESHPDPLNGAELCALYLSRHGPLAPEGDWLTHYRLRLAYENQMIEAQGGRAAFVEMEAGGWIGKHQIRKVNKSNATGRVVSVTLRMQGNRWGNEAKPGEHYDKAFNIERLPEDAYRPPTEEDKAAMAAKKKAEKDAAPKSDPCPLINPTDEDAAKLQEIWNEADGREKPSTPLRMTQAQYSEHSAGSYANCKTIVVCETGCAHWKRWGNFITRKDVFKIRSGPAKEYGSPRRVVILTDKPQKPLPWKALEAARAAAPSVEKLWDSLPQIAKELQQGFHHEFSQLLRDAEYVDWIRIQSMSQVSWTEQGAQAWKQFRESQPETATVNA